MRKHIILFAILALSACAIEPTVIKGPNGEQAYMFNCNNGTKMCYQKAAKYCPSGYDIIKHTNTSSELMPHYGEYPITVTVENLTIHCK